MSWELGVRSEKATHTGVCCVFSVSYKQEYFKKLLENETTRCMFCFKKNAEIHACEKSMDFSIVCTKLNLRFNLTFHELFNVPLNIFHSKYSSPRPHQAGVTASCFLGAPPVLPQMLLVSVGMKTLIWKAQQGQPYWVVLTSVQE